MESVVTFRIGQNHFGVPIRIVKWIVDVENVFSVTMMPEYVLGEIEQNRDLYFLVCLERLLGLGVCGRDPVGKSAIIVGIADREFAILVDEIEKIEEMEQVRNKEDKIEFVKDNDTVVEILKDSFFTQLHHIPTIKPSFQKQKEELLQEQTQERDEQSFLLFFVGEELFGIDAAMVEFVEVIEDAKKGVAIPKEFFMEGIYIVKNRLMYLLNLAKYLKLSPKSIENILVIREQNSYLGIGVGEISNIVSVAKEDLNFTKADDMSCCFFLYGDKVVTVLQDSYFYKLCEEYGIISHKQDSTKNRSGGETKEFVIIGVGQEELALPMEEIVSLHELDEVHITKSLEHKEALEGIVAIDAASYLLFDLERMVKNKANEEDFLILVMRSSENGKIFEYALRIRDIKQIIQVDVKDVYEVYSQEEQFIKGTVNLGKKVYNILNTRWIIRRLKEEHEK